MNETTAPPAEAAPPAPPLAREDALPEHADYRDRGCDLFASCLRCPLPRCRYDEPGGVRALLNRARDREIRLLRIEDGLAADEIAARFGVSRRTVFRALERGPSARRRARAAEDPAPGEARRGGEPRP